MKKRDLVKLLERAGFRLERHGRHEVYVRGNDEIEEIPRHREINELLAKSIIKKWNLGQAEE